MATIDLRGKIEAKVTLELSEAEAAALDALVGYGFEPFKKVFYSQLGEAYMRPHEAGLKSLFESVYGGPASVASFLKRSKDARAVFQGTKVAIARES